MHFESNVILIMNKDTTRSSTRVQKWFVGILVFVLVVGLVLVLSEILRKPTPRKPPQPPEEACEAFFGQVNQTLENDVQPQELDSVLHTVFNAVDRQYGYSLSVYGYANLLEDFQSTLYVKGDNPRALKIADVLEWAKQQEVYDMLSHEQKRFFYSIHNALPVSAEADPQKNLVTLARTLWRLKMELQLERRWDWNLVIGCINLFVGSAGLLFYPAGLLFYLIDVLRDVLRARVSNAP